MLVPYTSRFRAPAKNCCEASRPRPAARATTRMIRVVRLNMAEALFTQYLKCGHDNRATVILPGPAAQPLPRAAMTDELHTIIDLFRYGASRFTAAGLKLGTIYAHAIDQAPPLVRAANRRVGTDSGRQSKYRLTPD